MRFLPFFGLFVGIVLPPKIASDLVLIPANGSFAKENEIGNGAVGTASRQPGEAGAPGLHDLLLKTMHNTANYFGFGTNCKNGGHKTEDNQCICPKFYKGKECETKSCINGGKLEKVKIPTVHYVCTCPNPKYIEGTHCEKPRCANGGLFQTFKNGTWACDCSHLYVYRGKFCEKFITVPMTALAFGLLIVLACLAALCSLNCCQRRRHASERQEARCFEEASRRVRHEQRHARRVPREETLLSSERGAIRRTAAYPEGVVQPYVVRLDTIPTFNPAMIGGVEPASGPENRSTHPVGPPPSYDQALTAPLAINPPEYTPTDVTKRT